MNVDELVSSVCENCTYDEAEEHFDFNKFNRGIMPRKW